MNSVSLASSPIASEEPASPTHLRARLAAHAATEGPWIVAVRAPNVSLGAVLALGDDPVKLLWHPPEGPSFAALGAAEVLTGAGHDRIETVRERARSLFSRLAFDDTTRGEAPRPRLFGGFAFQPGRALRAPWAEFGDARFVLPRYGYTKTASGAVFTVASGVGETMSRDAVEGAVDLFASLGDARERTHAALPHARRLADEVSLEGWIELVDSIRDLIREGRFEKIVAARRTRVAFDRPVDPHDVLDELGRVAADCTRFAFRFGEATFLGVTPERLVRKRALAVDTEALAGSAQAGGEDRSIALGQSPKELKEHDLVLREIVRCLDPICTDVRHPPTPEIRRLRHILHLRTPIQATLTRPLHVLRLVERLHPTPAVGGVPTRAALQWIVEHEPVERGWYAAPVGWFDDTGDGEFDVALRSGVLSRTEAFLYAGGGIVADSDPRSEYAETELKLAALASALGLSE